MRIASIGLHYSMGFSIENLGLSDVLLEMVNGLYEGERYSSCRKLEQDEAWMRKYVYGRWKY